MRCFGPGWYCFKDGYCEGAVALIWPGRILSWNQITPSLSRVPPTSDLFDRALYGIVVDVADLHLESTYASPIGLHYECRWSECAMLRPVWANAVGMSTLPEILAAHYSGMAVLRLSLITNKVVYFDEQPDGKEDGGQANHVEVLVAMQGRG